MCNIRETSSAILWGQQDHAFLGSALHFIQITWFAYVF